MTKGLQILKKASLLLFVAFWLQKDADSGTPHNDSNLCGHSDSQSVCTCICHSAFESIAEAFVFVEQAKTAWVSSSNETNRGYLIPKDIFRPPLMNG